MARGFNYAPGASTEVLQAAEHGLDKAAIIALGSSRNALVRAAVASRADCPLGLMVSLAHDYSAQVRCAVARNPRAQRTVMAYLSADRSVDVIRALLENPALPPDLVDELAFHKKSEVRRAAAERLDRGAIAQDAMTREDSHTPELAEHVAPAQPATHAAQAMTADGALPPAFERSNVVEMARWAPVAPIAQPHEELSQPPSAGVPQIFSPHSAPGAPAPTRTAPVRGFKVPTD